jgi:hypothetical protein
MNKIYATIERRAQENALSNPTIDLLLLGSVAKTSE